MKYDPPSFSKVVHAPVPAGSGTNSTPIGFGGPPAKKLVITTEAATATNGTTLTTQPVVEVRNRFNVKIADSTAAVTVGFLSGANATLSGTTTVNAVAGVATFTNIALDSLSGDAVTLQYSSPGCYPARGQAMTTITYGAGTKSSINRQPVGSTSGAALATQPKINILDVDGRLVANSTVNVVASKASGTGTLGGTTTKAAVAGVATFTDLTVTTAGSCVLRFTPTAMTAIDSATVVTAA